MGSLFGKPDIPKPAPAPEPPPLPPPAPVPVTDTSSDVNEARREQRKAELRKMGRSSTIIAGGDLGGNGVNPGKTILGG